MSRWFNEGGRSRFSLPMTPFPMPEMTPAFDQTWPCNALNMRHPYLLRLERTSWLRLGMNRISNQQYGAVAGDRQAGRSKKKLKKITVRGEHNGIMSVAG